MDISVLVYFFLGVLLLKFFSKKVNVITNIFFGLAYYLPGAVATWLSLNESKNLEGPEMLGQGVLFLLSAVPILIIIIFGALDFVFRTLNLIINLLFKKTKNTDAENN
ncbi:MAG: hypothetical protein SFU55_00205 [Methylophilus sp.]|nr:hypothetical protein [Methylophilus sp.]